MTIRHIRFFYFSIALFAAIAITGILAGFDWILITPVIVFLIFLSFFGLDQILFLAVFLTPLSINLSETPLGFGISIPAEPLIFGLMLITFLKIIMDGGIDKKLLCHPVSILIILHLIWFVITTLTSTMLLVSVKYTLARIWFIMVFYFLVSKLFREQKNIFRFIWCYCISLMAVIVYTTLRHSAAGFTEKAAHVAMTPFYNDHTAYAAALALFLPPMISLVFLSGKGIFYRLFSLFFASVILVAIVLSYTRAAWVGLAVAFLSWLVFILRIDRRIVFSGIAVFIFVIFYMWTDIMIRLEQNRKQSSTEYAAHLQSISNISTDASNVERINRWSSAIRMFNEKPVFGWGPGTYQFKYAPFQRFNEKTSISTNAGNRGNSHSEYFGPLSEQGFLGVLLFVSILVVVIIRTSGIIRKTNNTQMKILCMGLLLGLITYWIHGMLNYFLDTDKASVPFWGFIAALTAIDIYHSRLNGESSPL